MRDVLLKPFHGISKLELDEPKVQKERQPPRYRRKLQRRRLSRAYALVLLGAGICKGAAMTAMKKEYMIYIDAGSSATRAFVYSWEAPDYDYLHLPPTMVRPERVKGNTEDFLEVKPGVSDYASFEMLTKLVPGSKGNNGLRALMDWCIQKLKEEGVTDLDVLKQIPLYLGCTAGVRILPRKHRESLMAELRRFFTSPTSTSPFLRDETFIRIIPGQEEGVYGWLAANYLLDTLGMEDTWGILDLGGASTQITFRPDTPYVLSNIYEVRLSALVEDSSESTVDAGSKERPGTVRLISHSFGYFGQEQALQRMDANLIASRGEAARVEVTKNDAKLTHPCLPKGIPPRPWNVNAQKFLPEDFVTVSNSLGFEGSSNFDECYLLALSLLEIGKHPCFVGEWPSVECGMVGQVLPKPPAGRKFLAVSSFWHLQEFLRPLLEANGTSGAPWPLSVWKDSIKTICEKTWEEICAHNKLLAKMMPEKYLSCYCALGAYAYSLLRDGYGFEEDSNQMYPMKTIGDQEFDIGFGFVLKHANDLPWRLSEQQQKDANEHIGMFAAWMSFFGAVLGGSIIVLIHPCVDRYFGLSKPMRSARPKSAEHTEPGVEMAEAFRPLRYSESTSFSGMPSSRTSGSVASGSAGARDSVRDGFSISLSARESFNVP